jgi:ribonuclease P/MRP protein subunit RPP1
MYEAVHVARNGPTTPGRFALTLSRAGFEGVVVRNPQSETVDVDADALAASHGIDVVQGIEIDAPDPSTASGAVGNWRPEAEVLIVRGADPDLNRFAAESPRVDVLADPMGGDGDVNHVVANAAAANSVALEVDLGQVLRSTGEDRVAAIAALRKLHDLIDDAGAPYVISAGPRSHLQVRGPRELRAVGERIGFSATEIENGLTAWGEIAERTRARRDPAKVAPGVTVEDSEADK